MMRSVMRSWVILVLVLLGTIRCAPSTREDLVKEVLAADPRFADVLDKRRTLANRIETYERELAFKRTTTRQTIKKLRGDLVASAAAVKRKRAATMKQMEPDRKRLTHALSMADEKFRAARAQRASLDRSIAELKRALKRSDGVWTAEERAQQEAKLEGMERDAADLDQDLVSLNDRVRLLKLKLVLIRL